MPIFADYLMVQLFAFLLIFCRVGAALVVMPGFGEIFVPSRVRLLIALTVSLIMVPMLQGLMPAMPDKIGILVLLITQEIIVGGFIGLAARILSSALHTAGTILATQSGLASGMMFDFTMAGQSTPVSNLLSFAGLIVIFAANLHHLMLQGIVDSYHIIPVVKGMATEDMAYMTASYLNTAFKVALQLSSPFIAMSIVLNLGGGVLARIMPTFQVFFVLMAPQMLIMFFLLMISVPAMMLWYLNFMQDGLSNLLSPM